MWPTPPRSQQTDRRHNSLPQLRDYFYSSVLLTHTHAQLTDYCAKRNWLRETASSISHTHGRDRRQRAYRAQSAHEAQKPHRDRSTEPNVPNTKRKKAYRTHTHSASHSRTCCRTRSVAFLLTCRGRRKGNNTHRQRLRRLCYSVGGVLVS